MSKKPTKPAEQAAVADQTKDKKPEQKPAQAVQEAAKNPQKGAAEQNQKSNANIPQQKSQNKLQVPGQAEAQQQPSQQKVPSKTNLEGGDKNRASVESLPNVKGDPNDKKQPSSAQIKQKDQSQSSQSQINPLTSGRDSNPSLVIQQQDLPSEKQKGKNASNTSKQPGIIVTGEKNQLLEPPIVEEKSPKSNILQESGLVGAYDYFLRQLCKNGLPTGNIFEYAAQEVLKYEKKKKQDHLKKLHQKTSGSPMNRTSTSPKKPESRNDSIEKQNNNSIIMNKAGKDSQFSKEANQKGKEKVEPENTKQQPQGKKDGKVEEKKVVSKDKVKEESPEKKKGDDKAKPQQQAPVAAATKGKK